MTETLTVAAVLAAVFLAGGGLQALQRPASPLTRLVDDWGEHGVNTP